MSDIATLHKTARSLILSIRDGLEQLERSESGFERSAGSARIKMLQQKLADLQRTSQQTDSMLRMQMVTETAAKRNIWKRKVDQVSEETDSLAAALDAHLRLPSTSARLTAQAFIDRRQVEAAQRDELFARASGAPDFRIERDADEQGQGYIQNSKRVLEEAFQTGTNVLSNMSGQRERIKSAQRKLFDVANSLGLSDSVLKVIDRRQKLDKRIVYGGMVLIVLLVLLLLWWLR
eukprot:jgi/Astpho2/4011/Aster-01172